MFKYSTEGRWGSVKSPFFNLDDFMAELETAIAWGIADGRETEGLTQHEAVDFLSKCRDIIEELRKNDTNTASRTNP